MICLMGVIPAAVIGITGNEAPLALVGKSFDTAPPWLWLIVFIGICAWLVRGVLNAEC